MAKQKAKLEQLEINDLETLKIITEPTRLAILEAVHDPCSVTEIAGRLGVPRTRLYHHINLLEEHGLIRQVSTRKKGALEEKVYEAAADSFAPGPDLLQSEDKTERVEAIVTGILDATREDLRLSLIENWADDDADRPKQTSLHRGLLWLSPEEGERFLEQVMSLFEEYAKLHEDGRAEEGLRLFAHTWAFYPSSRQP